jgi:hypothetical protein
MLCLPIDLTGMLGLWSSVQRGMIQEYIGGQVKFVRWTNFKLLVDTVGIFGLFPTHALYYYNYTSTRV